jgi:hypothetical protein
MDDGQGPVKGVRNLTTRIQKGPRFLRVDGINDADGNLISSGWQIVQIKRLSLGEIVDVMSANPPQFLFPGAKEAEVRRCIETMVRR